MKIIKNFDKRKLKKGIVAIQTPLRALEMPIIFYKRIGGEVKKRIVLMKFLFENHLWIDDDFFEEK